jgi:CheY-like chemotaxis protein
MENGRDVLIIEDDDCTRSLLATIVEYHGYRATVASDGSSGIATINGRDFAVLILDLLLPAQNGFEVLRHIQCTRPELLRRTIVVTAAAPRTFADCRELGEVRKVFLKPIEIDDLRAEIFALTNEMTTGMIAGAEEKRTSGRKERET